MIWLMMAQMAVAGQLVIIDDEKNKTPSLETLLDGDAEIVLWSELRGQPLTIAPIIQHDTCLGKNTSIESLEESLNNAEKAVNYVEINKALGHILRIQNDLVCLNEKVSKEFLITTHYLKGVAYFYEDDLERANQSWRQALLFDPELNWDPNIEPSGQPAFEQTKLDIQSQALSRMIVFPSDAPISMNGAKLDGSGDISAGTHFVQHDSLNYQGHVITTEVGADVYIISFADFPEDLEEVMGNEELSIELLSSLQVAHDKRNFLVVENNRLWHPNVSSNRWKAESFRNRIFVVQARPKLLAAGVGTVLVGSGALLLADITHDQYMDSSDVEAPDIYRTNRISWFTGTGLTIVGSGLMVMGTIQF